MPPRVQSIQSSRRPRALTPTCIGVVARLIDEVVGTTGQIAEKNKNRLVVEAQENLGALNADSMRLKQILLNLLSNACKFRKEGEAEALNRPVEWGILVQRAMNARFIIIRGIPTQDPAQVRLPEYDQVVETFPSDRADQSLDVRVRMIRRPAVALPNTALLTLTDSIS
jgi:hypothetical protein